MATGLDGNSIAKAIPLTLSTNVAGVQTFATVTDQVTSSTDLSDYYTFTLDRNTDLSLTYQDMSATGSSIEIYNSKNQKVSFDVLDGKTGTSSSGKTSFQASSALKNEITASNLTSGKYYIKVIGPKGTGGTTSSSETVAPYSFSVVTKIADTAGDDFRFSYDFGDIAANKTYTNSDYLGVGLAADNTTLVTIDGQDFYKLRLTDDIPSIDVVAKVLTKGVDTTKLTGDLFTQDEVTAGRSSAVISTQADSAGKMSFTDSTANMLKSGTYYLRLRVNDTAVTSNYDYNLIVTPKYDLAQSGNTIATAFNLQNLNDPAASTSGIQIRVTFKETVDATTGTSSYTYDVEKSTDSGTTWLPLALTSMNVAYNVERTLLSYNGWSFVLQGAPLDGETLSIVDNATVSGVSISSSNPSTALLLKGTSLSTSQEVLYSNTNSNLTYNSFYNYPFYATQNILSSVDKNDYYKFQISQMSDIKLRVRELSQQADLKIRIINSAGKVVSGVTGNVAETATKKGDVETSLDVSGLSAGIYYLQLYTSTDKSSYEYKITELSAQVSDMAGNAYGKSNPGGEITALNPLEIRDVNIYPKDAPYELGVQIPLAKASSFTDFLGASDGNDIYHVQIAENNTKLVVELRGTPNSPIGDKASTIDALDLEVQLFSTNNLTTPVASVDIADAAWRNGVLRYEYDLATNSITHTHQDSVGEYYIRVLNKNVENHEYTISASSQFNTLSSTNLYGGNGNLVTVPMKLYDATAGAFVETIGMNQLTTKDYIGDLDKNDYYLLNLDKRQKVTFTFDDNYQQNKLELLKDGKVVYTFTTGTDPNSSSSVTFSQELSAGKYVLHPVQAKKGVNTEYTLTVTPEIADTAGQTIADSRDLGSLGESGAILSSGALTYSTAGVVVNEYVGTNGRPGANATEKNDSYDFYKFTVTDNSTIDITVDQTSIIANLTVLRYDSVARDYVEVPVTAELLDTANNSSPATLNPTNTEVDFPTNSAERAVVHVKGYSITSPTTLDYPFLTPGEYYIRVKTDNVGGSYRLGVQANVLENNSLDKPTGTVLPVGVTPVNILTTADGISGYPYNFSADPAFQLDSGWNNNGGGVKYYNITGEASHSDIVGLTDSRDFYKINLNAPANLKITVTDANKGDIIRLLDRKGKTVTLNSTKMEFTTTGSGTDEFTISNVPGDSQNGIYYVTMNAGKSNTSSPYQISIEGQMVDLAGNSYTQAYNFGPLGTRGNIKNTVATLTDSLSGNDVDYYHFTMADTGYVDISVKDKNGGDLVDNTGTNTQGVTTQLVRVNADGTFDSAKTQGTLKGTVSFDSIQPTDRLTAGEYYLIVSPIGGTAGSVIEPTVSVNVVVPMKGNAVNDIDYQSGTTGEGRPEPSNYNVSNANIGYEIVRNDYISSTVDSVDFYTFYIDRDSQITITLDDRDSSGKFQGTKLELVDDAGRSISSSRFVNTPSTSLTTSSTSNQLVMNLTKDKGYVYNVDLKPNSYFLKVTAPKGVDTRYSLRVNSTVSDLAPNNQDNAYNLGILSPTTTNNVIKTDVIGDTILNTAVKTQPDGLGNLVPVQNDPQDWYKIAFADRPTGVDVFAKRVSTNSVAVDGVVDDDLLQVDLITSTGKTVKFTELTPNTNIVSLPTEPALGVLPALFSGQNYYLNVSQPNDTTGVTSTTKTPQDITGYQFYVQATFPTGSLFDGNSQEEAQDFISVSDQMNGTQLLDSFGSVIKTYTPNFGATVSDLGSKQYSASGFVGGTTTLNSRTVALDANDWYTFNLTQQSNDLNIVVDDDTGGTKFEIFNQSNLTTPVYTSTLKASDTAITTGLTGLAGGQYYVKVSNGGDLKVASNYSIKLDSRITDMGGQTVATAKDLGSQTAIGDIASFKESVSADDPLDYFKFTIYDTGTVSLKPTSLDSSGNTVSANGNVQIKVLDALGEDVTSSFTDGTNPVGDTIPLIEDSNNPIPASVASLSAGTYYVQIKSVDGISTNNYSLDIKTSALNNVRTTASQLGKTESGVLSSLAGIIAKSPDDFAKTDVLTDFVGKVDTTDFYRFNLSDTSDVVVNFDPETVGATIKVFDAFNNQVISPVVSKDSTGTEIELNRLSRGDYYIQVVNGKTDTQYTLSLSGKYSDIDSVSLNNPESFNDRSKAKDLGVLDVTGKAQNLTDMVRVAKKQAVDPITGLPGEITANADQDLYKFVVADWSDVELALRTWTITNSIHTSADVIKNQSEFAVGATGPVSAPVQVRIYNYNPENTNSKNVTMAKLSDGANYEFLISNSASAPNTFVKSINPATLVDPVTGDLLNVDGHPQALTFAPGEYYLQVSPVTDNITLSGTEGYLYGYDFDIRASYTDTGDGKGASKALNNNSISTAFPIDSYIASETNSVYKDYIGGNDVNDYFKFELSNVASDVVVKFDDDTVGNTIKLLNSKGAILKSLTSKLADGEILSMDGLGAGTYYLQVTPGKSIQTAYNFDVDVSVTDKSGATLDTARDFGLITLQGDSTRNKNPKMSDFLDSSKTSKSYDLTDSYKFTIADRSNVTLSKGGTNGNDIALSFDLQDQFGRSLTDQLGFGTNAISNPTATYTLDAGTYYVVANIDPLVTKSISYSLGLKADMPYNNTRGTAIKVNDDLGDGTGNIQALQFDTAYSYNEIIGSADTSDFYRIRIAAPSKLDISVTEDDAKLTGNKVTLLDSTGKAMTGYTFTTAKGSGQQEFSDIMPGEYYIQVSSGSSNKTGVGYALNLITRSDDKGGDDISLAGDLSYIGVNGDANRKMPQIKEFVSTNALTYDPTDWFKVTLLDEVRSMAVQMTPKLDAGVNLELYSSAGEAITLDSTSSSPSLMAGEYYVKVNLDAANATQDSLNYVLSLLPQFVSNNTKVSAYNAGSALQRLEDGAADASGVNLTKIQGSFQVNPIVYSDWLGDVDTVDYIKFDLEAAADVIFNLTDIVNEKYMGTKVTIYNSKNQKVGDYSTSSTNAGVNRLTNLGAGTYTVQITRPSTKGLNYSYNLSIDSSLSDVGANSVEEAKTLSSAYLGSLSLAGSVANRTKSTTDYIGIFDSTDVYRFNLVEKSKLELKLTGSDIILNTDVKAQLLDSKGVVIADNATSTPNTLSAGEYFVKLTPDATINNVVYKLDLTAMPLTTAMEERPALEQDVMVAPSLDRNQFNLSRSDSSVASLTASGNNKGLISDKVSNVGVLAIA